MKLIKNGLKWCKKQAGYLAASFCAAIALCPGQAHATASTYVANFQASADQMVTDVAAIIPIALGVFAVTFGVRVVMRVFKIGSRG